jgi:DNA topoisomerase-1
MKLIIVESPTKARTIQKYLGSDYKVIASQGHIRDLSFNGEGSLGVDIHNNFEPDYIISDRKKTIIGALKNAVSKADEVYLATDPDREGEAIAWHLADVLGLDVKSTKRLEFHEITRKSVKDALDNARIIDLNLVSSQETRRILDRIIGFELSGLLQKKIFTRSAGRVQSVALKLIIERQKEIDSFVEEISYGISGKVFNEKDYDFEMVDNELQPIRVDDSKQVENIINVIGKELRVKDITSEISVRNAKAPFTTSSLQQEAFSQFKFSASKTNKIAQKLYEGINIGEETTGLITYMRTDSIRVSGSFVFATKDYIKNAYGDEYVGFAKIQKEDAKVQDAHEAIRPTRVDIVPETIKEYLDKDEYKLYKLIWSRAVASIMKSAEIDVTKVVLEKDKHLFLTKGSVVKFDGYKKVYGEYENDNHIKLNEFESGKSYPVKKVEVKEHKTKPPFRYTEGTLIKAMEELGIGRPSTYASTIDSLKKSSYIYEERNYILPTLNGYNANNKLDEYFDDIINVEYTANMEKDLDSIAEGEKTKIDALSNFYEPFKNKIDYAYEHMSGPEIIKTGEKCPNCGKDLVKRQGKYGEFICCEDRPNCDYVKPKEITINENSKDCPKCKEGKLIVRHSKYGNFLGCSRFPDCDYMESFKKKSYYKKKEN